MQRSVHSPLLRDYYVLRNRVKVVGAYVLSVRYNVVLFSLARHESPFPLRA